MYKKYKESDLKNNPWLKTPSGGWGSLPKNKQHPKRLHKRAIRRTAKLFISHLFDILWMIKHPNLKIPRPMHFRNAPLKNNEIIVPFDSSINIKNYMSEKDILNIIDI